MIDDALVVGPAQGGCWIETQVQVRWSDADVLGHVNNAVYFTYTAFARMHVVETALGEGRWGEMVAAHIEIDYLREIPASYRYVRIRGAVVRIGNSSVRTREEIFLADGSLASRSEAVIVFRDLETGKSRPLTGAERASLAPFVIAEEPEV